MTSRQELLANALERRHREVCVVAAQLVPGHYGPMSDFVFEIQQQLEGSNFHDRVKLPLPDVWQQSGGDCLATLRQIALGESIPVQARTMPPVETFEQDLRSTRNDHDRRFHLLTRRYEYPLNFSLPQERDQREYVLSRTMSHDRTRFEKGTVDNGADDLLLRLNLIAVHSWVTCELRFLDALNYFYELMPGLDFHLHARHEWLLASYIALYARALSASSYKER